MNKWTKKVTEAGLSLMSEETRRERINKLMRGNLFYADAIAELVDECKSAVGLFIKEHGEKLELGEKENLEEQLEKIDGKEDVAGADPDELEEWVLELKNSIY